MPQTPLLIVSAKPTAAASGGEDVVDLLTNQHRSLEARLQALLECDNDFERAALLRRAGDELAVHVSAEEVVFYPAVHAVHALRTEDILLESLEEHLSLKRLLADLLVLPTQDTTFQPKCKVLEEQTRHHHKEEEEHLFPEVRRMLSAAQRRELGAQVQQHEQALAREGAPREAVKAETGTAKPLL